MTQKRLNHLLILSVYQEELDSVDITELVNDFIRRNDTRRLAFQYVEKK